jgi:DNA-binding XRE family transcriptional regulator
VSAPGVLALPGALILSTVSVQQNARYWFWTVLALPRRIHAVEPKVRVGLNVRAKRKELGITQEALAHRCNMHPVEIGRAERGLRDLRISTIVKLARGLGIAAGELLKGL